MEVRGPNFGQYDAQHIQQVQREIARSVKPNVLRQLEDDLDPESLLKLLSEDLVELSPEAREFLKKLRRRMKRHGERHMMEGNTREEFEELLGNLSELRASVDEEIEKAPPQGKPFIPPVIQLSGRNPGGGTAAAGRGNGSATPTGQAAELVDKMTYHAPNTAIRHQLMRELQVFGVQTIAQVKQFGVRIIVLDRDMALTDLKVAGMHVVGAGERTFDGRPWSMVRGLYDSSRRLLVVGEELLGMRSRSCARHEFAHAYEHAYSTRHRRTLPLSVELWNSFAKSRTGMVSNYASTNPAEYFAESVEAFFEEGPRQYLKTADPQMFDYLTGLFSAA